MLAAERRALIAQLVARQNAVTVAELCRRFQVSDMTIRRDLKSLEERGLLLRTHGGAVARDVGHDAAYGIREKERRAEKEAIARLAATIVAEGSTIFLDAGTTTARLARCLHGRDGLTVITNSLYVLHELGADERITLISTGGTLRHSTLSFVGSWAEEMVARFHADILFLAATAIDPQRGLFNSNVYEIGVKQQMIRAARRVVLLADHTKFGRQSTAKVADLSAINTVITDSGVAEGMVAALREQGIEVCVAKVE